MTTKASDYVKKQHAFNAEMRVKVNRKLYPEITSEQIQEFAQRIVEGEVIPGVIVEVFEVRGKDVKETIVDYHFAGGFIRNAERTTDVESPHSQTRKGRTK